MKKIILSLAGLPLILLTLHLGTVSADVVLMTSTNETFRYPDIAASFGKRVPTSGTLGVIYGASPSNGCSTLTNLTRPGPQLCAFVLLERGVCIFETKVRNAQAAGFDAAIVYNNEDESLITMSGDPEGILIHAVFVSKSAGEKMLTFVGDIDTSCFIRGSDENRSSFYLVLASISLLTMCAAVGIYCFLRRRNRYNEYRIYLN